MPLAPDSIQISFTEGVDTKDDPKQIYSKLLVLQNASFKSPREISKRDGFTGLTQATLLNSGTPIANGVGVASYKNELVSLDGAKLFSYSSGAAAQINKGPLIPVSLSVGPVVRDTHQQTHPDSAYNNGLKCYIWLDSGSGGGTNYSIADTTTGTVIINNSNITSLATKSKVLAVGTYFVIIYYNSSTTHLNYIAINTTTPTGIGAPVQISTNVTSTFDATVINGSIYLVYTANSTQLGFNTISSTLTLSSQVLVTTGHNAFSMSIVGDASNRAWIAYAATVAGSQNLYALTLNSALNSTIMGVTLVVSTMDGAGFLTYNITQHVSGSTSTIYYENNTGVFNWIRFNTVTLAALGSAGTPGTDTLFMRNMSLAAKVFTQGTNVYVPAVYGFNQASSFVSLEPTYFIINSSSLVVAKIAPGVAGGYYKNGVLPETLALSSTSFSFPYLIQDDLSSLNGNVFYKSGVQNATLNFTLPNAMPKAVAGNNLLLGSGQLWMYDGVNVVEHGFHIYPENISGLVAVTSGGAIGIGASTASLNQVQYSALYEWSDSQGQLHRSNPSVPVTVTLPQSGSVSSVSFNGNTTVNSKVITSVSSTTGLVLGQVFSGTGLPSGSYITAINAGASTVTMSAQATATGTTVSFTTVDVSQLTVTVMTLQPTLKTNVSIALYRTENNGTIFYRVSSLSALTYNTNTADTVLFTDVLPDAQIVGNEQLYTTGGTRGNIAAPAISALATFKNRVVYLSPENPHQFGYSQQILEGVPVEFNSQEFVENIDQQIVTASAISPLDDKIISFGPSRKFYTVGTGPSPNGLNNDFSDPAPIAGVSGCSNPDALIETPTGIIYQDAVKGFWLLDRALSEKYIGADVESFNSQTVTSAALFPNSTKAIFTLSSGSNLIYDYYVNQWEVDPLPSAAIDSTIFQNDLVYIQANGLALQQTPGTFSDNGTVIPISLTTGWISFAKLSGYQRVYEMLILGTYKSPHTLTVNIYTDYSTTASQTDTITVASEPFPYQFRIFLIQQKCQAIQVQITETQSVAGEGFSLSSLTFWVGIKKGLNKLPAAASYG